MAEDKSAAEHGTGKKHRLIKVWDLPTRLFHWTLVAMVVIGYLTGWIFPENTMGVHLWAGYITVLLLVFRLTWGLFGSEYSRLETFTFAPVHILEHLKELITLRPVKHYIGHNPTGSLMVFGLLFVLATITLSGLMVLGGEENQGPLAGAASYAVGDMAAGVHLVFVIVLLVMIVLHVGGVFFEIKLTGENLVRSMISGLKSVPADTPELKHRDPHPIAAIAVMGVFATLAGAMLWAFSTMPPSGIVAMPKNADYQTECGDCHVAFHPSLLPATSWQQLMKDLDDHFGEVATLYSNDLTIDITAYLTEYGGDKWDTEAANRFRNVDPAHPYQITATPYWVRKHENIDADVFKRKGVRAKSNCPACHTDEDTGRFDDQKIKIPKE